MAVWVVDLTILSTAIYPPDNDKWLDPGLVENQTWFFFLLLARMFASPKHFPKIYPKNDVS